MGLFGRVVKKDRVSVYGFKASLSDFAYGAHMEGDQIVLSKDLGGGRYTATRMTTEVTGSVEQGSFRLYFQPTTLTGEVTGDLMISSEDIDADLISEMMNCDTPIGMLGAYTPSRGDALQMMQSVTGSDPFEYGFSEDCLSSSYANFRRYHGTVPAGAMILFGDRLDGSNEAGTDGDVPARDMDRLYGFHPSGDDIVLATDLGGGKYGFTSIVETDVTDDSPRMMITLSVIEDYGLGIRRVAISDDPIPHDLAIRISRDMLRVGILSVYVCDRSHAYELMTEVNGGRKPKDRRVGGIPCLEGRESGVHIPRIFYGPIPEDSPGKQS